MSSNTGTVQKVATENTISKPAYHEVFPVNWVDWDFVKDRICKCRMKVDIWPMAFSFFFSAAIFALSVALTADRNAIADTWRVFYFTTAGGFGLAALLSVAARWREGHAQHEEVGRVIEDMKQIEIRYQRPKEESKSPPKVQVNPEGMALKD